MNYTDLTKEQQKRVRDENGLSHNELKREDPLFVPEDEFEEYAQEEAEAIGAIDNDSQWPISCINWEWAARELKMDYSGIEIDGQSYYYRAG